MLTADKEKLIGETTSFEFCAFTRAWRSYQAFRTQRGIAPAAESTESLTNAARWIEGLTSRRSGFPYVYKLAALIFRSSNVPKMPSGRSRATVNWCLRRESPIRTRNHSRTV